MYKLIMKITVTVTVTVTIIMMMITLGLHIEEQIQQHLTGHIEPKRLPGFKVIKPNYSSSLTKSPSKLERLSLAKTSGDPMDKL